MKHGPLDQVIKLMTDARNLLPQRLPSEPLFHYTDAAGLSAMMQAGEIWASAVNCLNDTQEIDHGIEIVRKEAERRKPSPELGSLFQQAFKRAHLAGANGSVFVASFTRAEDQLGQWRAYAADGAGYAIGFRPNALRRMTLAGQPSHVGPADLRIVRVNYKGVRTKQRIAAQFVTRAFKSLQIVRQQDPSLQLFPFAADLIYVRLLELVASWKSSAFAEEKEWRLIFVWPAGAQAGRLQPSARIGRYGWTPYLRLAFDRASAIKVVRCGPKRHEHRDAQVVRALLQNAGIGGAPRVVHSAASYR